MNEIKTWVRVVKVGRVPTTWLVRESYNTAKAAAKAAKAGHTVMASYTYGWNRGQVIDTMYDRVEVLA